MSSPDISYVNNSKNCLMLISLTQLGLQKKDFLGYSASHIWLIWFRVSGFMFSVLTFWGVRWVKNNYKPFKTVFCLVL